MKIASYTVITLIVLWSILTILTLWTTFVSMEFYWKISLTMGLIGGGIIIASLIVREYLSEKKMKKDKFIT